MSHSSVRNCILFCILLYLQWPSRRKDLDCVGEEHSSHIAYNSLYIFRNRPYSASPGYTDNDHNHLSDVSMPHQFGWSGANFDTPNHLPVKCYKFRTWLGFWGKLSVRLSARLRRTLLLFALPRYLRLGVRLGKKFKVILRQLKLRLPPDSRGTADQKIMFFQFILSIHLIPFFFQILISITGSLYFLKYCGVITKLG